ncbi:TPA: hypothetical protein ACH3X1_006412 [Trebouxia sp. C0004]
MHSAGSSCLFTNAATHVSSFRARRAKPRVLVSCSSKRAGHTKDLAALLSSMGLCVTAQTALPVYANTTNFRVQPEHTVSVRRALLEDLLMKEMGTRLKSLSDDDLMLVLEQVHGSTIPLSLTAPSLRNTDDNSTLNAPSSSSSSSSSNASATQDPLTDRQASHSLASSSSETAAKDDKHMSATQFTSAPVTGAKLPDALVGQQAKDAVDKLPGLDERLQQAEGTAGKLPDVSRMRQEAKAAADALPDAWQQQTFRLQAFTRPLMQRLQGSPSTPQVIKPALEAQQPQARAAQASPSSSSLSGQQPLSRQEPGTSQQLSDDDAQQQDVPNEGTASPAEVEEEAQASSAGGQGVSAAELNSREAASDSSQAAASGTLAPAPRASGLTGHAEEGSARQPLDSKEQQAVTDKAEDATTRMLQSAGVALPSSGSNPSTSAEGSAAQPAQVGDPTVASYLGAIWRRTLPQLLFLASVTTFSTLAAAGATTARLKLQPVAQLAQAPIKAADNASQSGHVLTGLAAANQAVWMRLSDIAGRSRTGANGSAEGASQGSLQLRLPSGQSAAGLLPDRGPQHQQHTNGQGDWAGNGHLPVLDEWGRGVIQFEPPEHVSSEDQGLKRDNSAEQSAGSGPGPILWVRNDPEEQSGTDQVDKAAVQAILWRRGHPDDQSTGKAPTEAAVVPVRLRRSRLHRHDVSVESLLDNVE